MRSFILIGCIAGVAFVLQGCGGGGKPAPPPTCLAGAMNLVSQSASGTLTGKVSIAGQDITITDGSFVSKIDLDVFNARMDLNATIQGGKAEARVILNADTKVGVVYYKISAGPVVVKHACTKYPLPVSVDQLKAQFKQYLPKIQQAAKCDGNDGTYDSWKLAYDQTLPAPASESVSVDGTIKMDKSSLMDSANIHLALDVGGTKEDESFDLQTGVPTTAGGPKAADLDYSDTSKWGECKEGKPPTPLTMAKLFEPVDSPDASLTVERLLNMHLFPKVVLHAMSQAKKKKEVVAAIQEVKGVVVKKDVVV